jgi:Mrp family chromosome partitioning ATPase
VNVQEVWYNILFSDLLHRESLSEVSKKGRTWRKINDDENKFRSFVRAYAQHCVHDCLPEDYTTIQLSDRLRKGAKVMVIALVNHKGGVGKTTCTLNIGAGLQRMGKSVLLIDADAQANLTTCVGLTQEEPITLYDVMLERATIEEALVKRENAADIVPASLELTG